MTSTPTNETLSDVEVVGDVATVVFTRFNGRDNDVVARSFNLNRPSLINQLLNALRTLIAGSSGPIKFVLEMILTTIENALASGNTGAACAWLQIFIDQVTTQRGKKIPAATADAWIAAAKQIRAELACP